MARKPDERIEKAKKMFEDGMIIVEIAEHLNLSEGTVRSWKCRYKWGKNENATLQNEKRNVANKKGGQPKNTNAVGNSGGSAPPQNSNAQKHGLFAKFLPAETNEIMEAVDQLDPLDILWEQIRIQFAAIIRAQKIAFVRDQEDKTIEKVQEQSGKIIGEKWEVQQAWDKQNNFLQAQARAMTSLSGMLKNYDEMLQRRGDAATKEQKERLARMKADTARIKADTERIKADTARANGTPPDQDAINDFIKATRPTKEELTELYRGDADG